MIYNAFLFGPYNKDGELMVNDADVICFDPMSHLYGVDSKLEISLEGEEKLHGLLLWNLFKDEPFIKFNPSENYDNLDEGYRTYSDNREGVLPESHLNDQVVENLGDKLLVFEYFDHDFYGPDEPAKVWFGLKWVISKRALDLMLNR